MKNLSVLFRTGTCFLFFVGVVAFTPESSFKKQQVQFSRVRAAFAEKEKAVKALFTTCNTDFNKVQLYIRVFKQEGTLEVWAKDSAEEPFALIQSYVVCASSGVLGPKRQQGDGQVPEGFYYIDRFNPQSYFHLSLGINYPNAADRVRANKVHPGGDIFIHGACATVGCMPLTDDKIKELYVMAVEARSNGQTKIPVHIFPSRLSSHNWEKLKQLYQHDASLLQFWKNLKMGYDWFETNKQLPVISTDSQGQYLFTKALSAVRPRV